MIDARVLRAAPIADFVNSIVNQTNGFTTLIVCSTREKFLDQLTASLATCVQESESNHDSSKDEQSPIPPHHKPESSVNLLSNTLATIASSRRTSLVFCSSLAQLRAYLSTFRLLPIQGSKKNLEDYAQGGKANTIAILDLIAMHYLSTEFSAQGLSRTLALAIETATRTESSIVLSECSDAINVGNPDHGPRLWELRVPVLNGGTIRLDHPKTTASTARSSRDVSVRRVTERWFRFD